MGCSDPYVTLPNITVIIRHQKRYQHYNSDLSEVSSSDETTEHSSSEESESPDPTSESNRVSSSDGEIEIDECIFTINDESAEKQIPLKPKKRKIHDNSSKHPKPSKVRKIRQKCEPIKNKKSRKKFKIKAVPPISVSFKLTYTNYDLFHWMTHKLCRFLYLDKLSDILTIIIDSSQYLYW